MNKNTLIVIAAIVLVGALAVWGYKAYKNSPASYDTGYSSTQPLASAQTAIQETVQDIKDTKTILLGEQNYSGEKGTAILTELTADGKVKVVLEMLGEPTGAVQPAHIHLGSCPTPGAVKYPLTNVVNGKSETTINTTMDDLMKLGPLAINIHESSAKINNYVACGDVKF